MVFLLGCFFFWGDVSSNLRSWWQINRDSTVCSIKVSSGSSGWGGGKKHEIYAAAFDGHIFMTYFYGAGGSCPLPLPGSATESKATELSSWFQNQAHMIGVVQCRELSEPEKGACSSISF